MFSKATYRTTNALSIHRVLSQLASAGPKLWNSLPDDITVCFIIDSVSAKTESIYFISHI